MSPALPSAWNSRDRIHRRLTTKKSAYLGEVDVGNDNHVDGAGGVLGRRAGVTAGVVLVLSLAGAGLPRHAALGDCDGGLGCRLGWGTA